MRTSYVFRPQAMCHSLLICLHRIGYENTVPMMQYGDRFRRQRRWIHDAMSTKSALESYQPLMLRNVYVLLQDLLTSPEAFSEHLYKQVAFYRRCLQVLKKYRFRYVASSILEVTYGRRLTSVHDPLVVYAETAFEATDDSGCAGALLVDFVPICETILSANSRPSPHAVRCAHSEVLAIMDAWSAVQATCDACARLLTGVPENGDGRSGESYGKINPSESSYYACLSLKSCPG